MRGGGLQFKIRPRRPSRRPAQTGSQSLDAPTPPYRPPGLSAAVPARPSTIAVPPLRDRTLLVATMLVIALTWAGLAITSWRERGDTIDDWRFFLANLSGMAAQHADQTLAAADGSAGTRGGRRQQDRAGRRRRPRRQGRHARHVRAAAAPPERPAADRRGVAASPATGKLINFTRAFPTPEVEPVRPRLPGGASRAPTSSTVFLSANR